jgi:hypothetical protein
MSKQLVDAWFRARPTFMVSFVDSVLKPIFDGGSIPVEVKIRFIYETDFFNGWYYWNYDLGDYYTDARDDFMRDVAEYVQDTLGVDKADGGYPQIFQMVLNERGGLK